MNPPWYLFGISMLVAVAAVVAPACLAPHADVGKTARAAPPERQDARPASRPTSGPAETAGLDALWSGFKQLLPRGRIAAIREPKFVKAAEARIRPGSWVLGVVVEGKARAYSLNLLNRHEIVNDVAGGTAFAAVW